MPSSASGVQHVLGHHLRGIIVGLGQRHFELAIEGFLADLHGGAGLDGDLRGERHGFALRASRRHHAIDQADARALRRPRSSRRSAASPSRALRETLRDSATMGVEQNRPILTPGVAKRAAGGGHRQIAACHQLAARRRGDALHLGDDGLGMAHDRLHQLRALREQGGEGGLAIVGIRAVRRHFLEIVAGAESRAVRGDDDDAHGLSSRRHRALICSAAIRRFAQAHCARPAG